MNVSKRIRCLSMALVFLSTIGISGGTTIAQKSPPEVLTFKSDEMGLSIKHSAGWSVAPSFYSNQIKLINVPSHSRASVPATSSVKVFVESRLNHDDAVQRLQQIAIGMNAPESAFIEIGGWPAVQYGRIVDRPKPSKATGVEDHEMFLVSTVIAVGDEVVRMQGILPSAANENMKNEARFIGRGMGFNAKGIAAKTTKELQQLRANAADRKTSKDKNTAESVGGAANLSAVLDSFTVHAETAEGFNQRVLMTGFGEVEIAVSPDGQNIIIGRQGDWVASNDSGQTFSAPQTVGAFDGGDPSVAYAQSGAFYYAGIDRGCAAADVAGPNGYDCTGMSQSLDNGANFPLVTPAVVCPARDTTAATVPVPGNLGCFPDQEHIAADAFNAGAGGGDQVYSVWRNFDELGGQDPGIVCSQDSGQNWSAPAVVDTPGGSSFPRVAVGSDGSVYVAYFDGGNYELRKYSSCANGLVPQPIVTVGTRTAVECPFAGHDRCDQNPSSQMVAVDDTNPNHIYYAYGQNAAAGTDNILVRDSLDAGATWPAGRIVQVNAAVPGKRIMPWVCASEGQAYVTWYDRRAAPANQNDLTDFYGGRVGLDGLGDLVVDEEFRISEVGDPWCASGWPCGTRGAPGASETCFAQPQMAGYCGTTPPYSAASRCDFSDCGGPGNNDGAGGTGTCQCPGGQVCQAGSISGNAGGCPKYGDYNGNACMAGRLYAAWASATSPVGVPAPDAGRIGMLFDFFLLGDVSQIQIPGALDFGDVCENDGVLTETLEVCNTGNSNLAVNSISSDNAQFSVDDPVGGYPVTIGAGSCFPFQADFDPNTAGDATATLTILSNDPATPEILATLDASVGEASFSTFIADSGEYGELCSGEFSDLNLTIQSNGSCPLEIDSITLSGADGGDFDLPDGSLAGTIIEAGNSLLLPVRFTPANTSDANPRTASVDVASSTQNGDSLTLDQTPVQGSTGLASVITFIADSGDFSNVCTDTVKDLNLTIQSNGSCALAIDTLSLTGGDAADFLLPNGPIAGSIIEVGNSLVVPIRFAPTNFGDPTPRVASVDLASHTPGGDALGLNQTPIAGTVPPPDLNVAIADSGDFGDVCATEQADLNLTLFNAGLCNLTIDAITSDNVLFELPSDTQYPLVLSHDADFNFPVRFAPNICSDDPITGTLTIDSDSPGEELLDIGVGGAIPCPNLVIDPVGLSGDFAFPATVMDLDGSLGCFSERSAVVRNTGKCPLTIESITALGDIADAEFSVQAPSSASFPLVLPPGEETLEVMVRFTPQVLGDPLAPDEFRGELAIVSDDPDAAGTAELCGEGVAQSGIRVLATDISTGLPLPVDGVDNITIRSKGKKTPSPINLQFTDVMWQQTTICDNTVTWHVDQETLPATQTTGSNPKSSYEVSAKEGNLQDSQSFTLAQCEFLEFQLQFQDSDAPACLLLEKGAACTSAGECCSGKCKGPDGGKTCK